MFVPLALLALAVLVMSGRSGDRRPSAAAAVGLWLVLVLAPLAWLHWIRTGDLRWMAAGAVAGSILLLLVVLVVLAVAA